MKNKLRKMVVLLSTILFFNLILCINSSSLEINSPIDDQQIIVDYQGKGDFNTIQEAINYCPQGSTIYVKNGEYTEILNIKKQIKIIGENKNQTIINPISEKNKYAIRLGASGIELSFLSITNGAPGLYSTGIKICSTNTKIMNCVIYNNPVGIAVWTSKNIIDNCIFKNCNDEGIVLLGTPNSECKNNQILNCVFYNNCDGIELQYSSENTIRNCEIYDNTHTGIDAIASGNNNNLITNCKIYNNRVNGIYFSSSSENKIINCDINNNKDGDIKMNDKSKNNQISNNVKEDVGEEKTNSEIRLIFFEMITNIFSFKNHDFIRLFNF